MLVKAEGRYEIHYDPTLEMFSAYVDREKVCEAPTQKEVEEFAKQAVKKAFKRIPAIRCFAGRAIPGEITSIVKEHSSYSSGILVWFVTKEDSKSSREKLRLSRGVFYEATPENAQLVKEIEELNSKRAEIEGQIRDKQSQFSDGITDENILKLAYPTSEREG